MVMSYLSEISAGSAGERRHTTHAHWPTTAASLSPSFITVDSVVPDARRTVEVASVGAAPHLLGGSETHLLTGTLVYPEVHGRNPAPARSRKRLGHGRCGSKHLISRKVGFVYWEERKQRKKKEGKVVVPVIILVALLMVCTIITTGRIIVILNELLNLESKGYNISAVITVLRHIMYHNISNQIDTKVCVGRTKVQRLCLKR